MKNATRKQRESFICYLLPSGTFGTIPVNKGKGIRTAAFCDSQCTNGARRTEPLLLLISHDNRCDASPKRKQKNPAPLQSCQEVGI